MDNTTTTTLIRGGTVLLGAPRGARFERLDLLIIDGAIAAIGRDLLNDAVEVIDATGTVIIPGFVDLHHHLWETNLRSMTAEWDIIDFSWGIRFHHSAIQSPEDIYAGTYAGALAAVDAGITTTVDFNHAINSPEHAREGIRAVQDAGIRALFAYGLIAAPFAPSGFDHDAARRDDLRALRSELFSSNDASSLVRLGVAVNDIGGVPWEQTRAEYELARELDLTSTSHTNSTWSPQRAPEISWLHHDRLLGPGQVHAHMNTTSTHELQLVADAGAAIASTPETELQMGMGFPILARAAQRGVPAGLGTDIQANNAADMFTQMRLGMHAENARTNQPILNAWGTGALHGVAMSPGEALHHATLGGAEALGLGAITGSIELGKAADLILVRTDQLHHRPLIDPMAILVQHSRVSDIDTVIVGGTVRKRGGRLDRDTSRRAVALVDAAWDRLGPQIDARGGKLPARAEGLLEQMLQASTSNAPGWASEITQ
ncbi:amidohydrolase family protein [Microbacterium sp. P06]|uniref:amidohydrolase family protein n=1 Tax=Microbacterium sp. P06 TaxID=3366949 RepID=UPI00374743B9